MNFRIITIPFDETKELFLEEELNKFTVNKKILNYKAEFFVKNDKAFWTIFIEYENVHLESKGQSTKHIESSLSESDKLLFQKLKDWRKETAEKQGYPVYIVANNKELLSIINDKPKSLEALKNIEGFGVKKIESYGKEIIDIMKMSEE